MNGIITRRRARFFAEHHVLLALLVVGVLAGACWWGKGRGIKSRVGKAVGISWPARREPPRVIVARPADGDRAVPPDGRITIKVYLPNGRLDPTTLHAASVTLARASDGVAAPASVSTLHDGRFLVLNPSAAPTSRKCGTWWSTCPAPSAIT